MGAVHKSKTGTNGGMVVQQEHHLTNGRGSGVCRRGRSDKISPSIRFDSLGPTDPEEDPSTGNGTDDEEMEQQQQQWMMMEWSRAYFRFPFRYKWRDSFPSSCSIEDEQRKNCEECHSLIR